MPEKCAQSLYGDDGNYEAICTQLIGTEHSHHDMTAKEAVANGLAVKVIDEDENYYAIPIDFTPHLVDIVDSIEKGYLLGIVSEEDGGIIAYILDDKSRVGLILTLLNTYLKNIPVNLNPGSMANTAEESAWVKQYLNTVNAKERQRIAFEYPLEYDEWCTEKENS